jgi:hypothetical protein
VILYKKAAQLRIRRVAAPEPPYWAATIVAPYGPRRAAPVAIDYVGLRATAADRLEVTVAEQVRDELERTRALHEPVLIDAAEIAEFVFRRGEDVLAFCREQQLGALHLTSTRGTLPQVEHDATIVISAWPLELHRLEPMFGGARGAKWGVAVPVIYPVTTNLAALTELADAAKKYGASFLAPLAVELDPTAKHAIAQSLAEDDDAYQTLFHADLEPLHVATERHIAALAAERGLADFIVPPRWEERSNWNGAVLLTLTASRMIAMDLDVDLATTLARSARAVSELDKPLTRIAEAASLAIVEALDSVSVELLHEWIDGHDEPEFVAWVNRKWRVRRDYVGG